MPVTVLSEIIDRYYAAKSKHDCSGYGHDQMGDALIGEIIELGDAESRADIHGPHGMVSEHLDCIAVHIRCILRLRELYPVVEVEG